MTLTIEEGQELICDRLDGWEKIETKIESHERWTVIYSGVFKHKDTGKFYETWWIVGATENQDEQPFDNEAPELREVEPRQIMVTQYYPVGEVN